MKSRKVTIPPEVFMQLESLQKALARHQERASELKLEIQTLDLPTAKEAVNAWKLELRDLRPQFRLLAESLRQIALANSRPPFEAEYMLHLILGRDERAAVMGDLIEEYRYIHRRFGRRRADIWFYKQVLGSVWPFLQHAAFRVSKLLWLARILRHFTG